MGNEDFDGFCRDAYPSVFRLAYFVTGDRSDAEEVAQEAFARAFARWRRVRALSAPDAWTRRVAVNLAISARRRARVRRAFVPERARVVDPPEPPDTELIDALRSLTAAQRAVVVLRFAEDLSIDEVAMQLGKAPGTVRALTAQATTRLRVRLAREEVRDDA